MADKIRVNVYIPRDVVESVDKYAEKFCTNRSVMMGFMLQSYIDQQKVLEMSEWADKINEKISLLESQK